MTVILTHYLSFLQQIATCKMMVVRSCEFWKRHLNFDEFSSYSREKKLVKLNEIVGTIKDGEMPLTSYTAIHQKENFSCLIDA